jgi:hypothetical protein
MVALGSAKVEGVFIYTLTFSNDIPSYGVDYENNSGTICRIGLHR